MPDKTLKKAAGLFHSKKFQEAIKLLEPLVFQYRDNFSFYYYLGTACLYIGDFGGAFSYLNRALQLKKDNIDCLLGLAVIYLKRRETDKSLQIWLDILEKSPGQRTAQRSLNLLRKSNSPDELFSSKHKAEQIFPPIVNKLILVKRLLIFLSVLCLTAFSVYLGFPYLPVFLNRFSPREGIDNFKLSTTNEWLASDKSATYPGAATDKSKQSGQSIYIYTQEEIKNIYQKAQDYFLHYRDNLAQLEANRLLLSNASLEIKEKMETLRQYIQKPDFTSLKDTFSYQEVFKEPVLYEHCYVNWKGKIANLNISKDKISFEFLVGYHQEEELAGTVPVNLHFGTNIKNGDNLEILAQITLVKAQVVLEGVSVHKLMSATNTP